MKYFLLFTSLACFGLAIACAGLNKASEADPQSAQVPFSQSDREPGFVHK